LIDIRDGCGSGDGDRDDDEIRFFAIFFGFFTNTGVGVFLRGEATGAFLSRGADAEGLDFDSARCFTGGSLRVFLS
jgi:hypothetical protein